MVGGQRLSQFYLKEFFECLFLILCSLNMILGFVGMLSCDRPISVCDDAGAVVTVQYNCL